MLGQTKQTLAEYIVFDEMEKYKLLHLWQSILSLYDFDPNAVLLFSAN